MDLLESQKLYHKTMKQEFLWKNGGNTMKRDGELNRNGYNAAKKYVEEAELIVLK